MRELTTMGANRPVVGSKVAFAVAAFAVTICVWWVLGREAVGEPVPRPQVDRATSLPVTATAAGVGLAPAVEQEAVAPIAAAEATRVVAGREPIDVPRLAEEFVRAHPLPTGDGGLDSIVESIGLVLAPEPSSGAGSSAVDPRAAFAVAVGSVDEWAKRADVNPLGVALSPADVAQLGSLLREYSEQLFRLNRDVYLAQQIGLGGAIEAREFREVPNGKWPEGLNDELFASAREKAPGRDENATVLPGRDLSHRRFVVLTRECARDYFDRRDSMALTRAELDLAVRSFFVSMRR